MDFSLYSLAAEMRPFIDCDFRLDMSGRKLSGSQRRTGKVAIDNEGKTSSHLMERLLRNAFHQLFSKLKLFLSYFSPRASTGQDRLCELELLGGETVEKINFDFEIDLEIYKFAYTKVRKVILV